MNNKRLLVLCILLTLTFGILKFFGLSRLKDAFIDSPLCEVYVKYYRDKQSIDDDHVVTTLDNGMSIIVNKHDRCVCWFTRVTGYWDSNETRVLEKIIQPGLKIVEVGSNFGVHTLRMAELVGSAGKIYAFEANPAVSRYLKQSITMNGLTDIIHLYEMGAGDKSEQKHFASSTKNIGGGHVIPSQTPGSITVNLIRLDDIVPPGHIDILKMDVEGYELKALKGAQSIIDRNADHIILMLEFSSELCQLHGYAASDIVDFLKSYNFKLWKIGKRNLGEDIFVPITYDDLRGIKYADIVASRKDLGE